LALNREREYGISALLVVTPRGKFEPAPTAVVAVDLDARLSTNPVNAVS
jgi:hypothetical protein